jgi:hypothetical protein
MPNLSLLALVAHQEGVDGRLLGAALPPSARGTKLVTVMPVPRATAQAERPAATASPQFRRSRLALRGTSQTYASQRPLILPRSAEGPFLWRTAGLMRTQSHQP